MPHRVAQDGHAASADEIDDGPGLKGFFASLFGGSVQTTKAADLVAAWKKVIPQFTCAQHLITNHLIDVEGDTAFADDTDAIANITSESRTTYEAADLTALRIFAENYNVLRIMSGMGGLAYSN